MVFKIDYDTVNFKKSYMTSQIFSIFKPFPLQNPGCVPGQV